MGGSIAATGYANAENVQVGPRPFYLLNDMDEGPLKEKLQACAVDYKASRSQFSISHRGAPLQIPEHSKEGYQAAGQMGAGIIECDVTFTKDKELVCRHSQCDLATTTDILVRPELAAKCTKSFWPGASAKCCTSDLTLVEYMSLNGKMDTSNKNARTPASFMNTTAKWRTDLYATKATLVTHKQSIEIIGKTGAKFIPEIKTPSVKMPFGGNFSQSDFIEKLIAEYKSAGVAASDVYIQSFDLKDIVYLLKNHPEFGKQATWIDWRYRSGRFNSNNPQTLNPTMDELFEKGVRIVSTPIWVLIKVDDGGNFVPTAYAIAAKKSGLDIMAWTLERSGPLERGGGWYYKSMTGSINNDGDMYNVLDVLAKQVGIKGIFTDWPATVTFYANCMGL